MIQVHDQTGSERHGGASAIKTSAVGAMSPATVMLIVMSGTWALLISIIRWPMGSPGSSAALKVFLLSGAVMLTWREASHRVLSGQWKSYSLALLATLAVLFSPAIGWILGAAVTPILDIALVAVWIVGLRGLIADCRLQPLWQLAASISLGLVLGAAYFLLVNTRNYGNVFSPEQMQLGIQHGDTLFHSSIAAMLSRLGVPSTGLDGLVPIRYHVLSHALIGLTGRWMHVPPIHAYYLTQQVLGIPLLLFSLAAATFWVWRPDRTAAGGLLALLVPLLLLLTFEVWDWGAYLVSESYALALVLLLLSLPLVMELHERPRIERTVVRYATLALVGMAIVFAKNSVGAVFACGVLWVAARAHRFRPLPPLVFGAAIALIGGFGLRVTSPSGYSEESLIGPLHFVRAYPESAWPNIWAIALLLTPAVWLWKADARGRRVTVELLMVLTLASLCSGLLLHLRAGAEYYFMNVGVWIAIVLSAGGWLLPRLVALRRQGTVAAILTTLAVIAILASPDKRNAGSNVVAVAAALETRLREVDPSIPPPGPRPGLLAFLSPRDTLRPGIAGAIRGTPGGRTLERLTAAADARVEAVYVPPANAEFWKMHRLCLAQPFFVPALSGLPMVLGLPPDSGECPLVADLYGYGLYGETSRSVWLSDADLCRKLKGLGFGTALVLESPDASRIVSCS